MTELLNAFDAYKDFEREGYFAVCFNKIASFLSLETPLKETKENMEAVIEAINIPLAKLEIIYKTWSTEDNKNADFSKDFPYQYLFKSQEKALLLWVSLNNDELYMQYLYDCADTELEQWVIDTNHSIRTKFGLDRTPVFKVLSRNRNDFFTEDVRTEGYQSDIKTMYNDDFQEVDGLIEDALGSQKAGLILLHGMPGTGKTSYIKHLITKFHDKDFIFIQNEFVNELLHPDFISFLLKHQNAVLIIEDAEKVLMSREKISENSVVSTILQLTDGLFSDYLNIKIICTFNTSINKIDAALLRKGRMIAYYEFNALTPQKTDSLLQSMGHAPVNRAMTLTDIFNYQQKGFNQNEKRKIGFQK